MHNEHELVLPWGDTLAMGPDGRVSLFIHGRRYRPRGPILTDQGFVPARLWVAAQYEAGVLDLVQRFLNDQANPFIRHAAAFLLLNQICSQV
jgi:hypothetical protein